MSGYETVQAVSTLALKAGATGNVGQAQAACPAGKVAVGGGYRVTFGWTQALGVEGSYPAAGGWAVGFRNTGLTDVNFTVNVFAVCVYVAD
jgi:hypothetical protein